MNDDVLKVAVSLDSKYVAVSLLDNTVKVWLLSLLWSDLISLLCLYM